MKYCLTFWDAAGQDWLLGPVGAARPRLEQDFQQTRFDPGCGSGRLGHAQPERLIKLHRWQRPGTTAREQPAAEFDDRFMPKPGLTARLRPPASPSRPAHGR